MLRTRLITVLTLFDGILYRTRDFNPDYRYTSNFVDLWSVDEIAVLDITRSGQGERSNFLKAVRQFAQNCAVPLSVGGGVRKIQDFETLLRNGADKVIFNTGAVEKPELIQEAAKTYGTQCVVVSIDAWRHEDGSYEVFTHFGSNPTSLDPVNWSKKACELGAGEILITAIQKDGTLEGYDNELNAQVIESVNIPVLICGGAGSWEHFVKGLTESKAAAICTQNIYHFTETSISSAKTYLNNFGIPVRK